MRLQGQAQLGYFPTPTSQTERITTWIRCDPGSSDQLTRILDPCAGQGEALAQLANSLGKNIQTFGIELSPQRAKIAEAVLGQVLPTGFENALLTEETFSLILLNPPYDGETMTGRGQRMEYTFLPPSTRLLVRGGLLVYIIPEPRISLEIAKHLAGWYENLRCFRFTPNEYVAYKQVVIFGTRRQEYKQPSQAETDLILAWRNGHIISIQSTGTQKLPSFAPDQGTQYLPLPSLSTGHGEYVIPTSPQQGPKGKVFRFQYLPVGAEDYLRAAEVCAANIEKTSAWQAMIPETKPLAITPAITPKLGHVSMQVSGGLLGTNPVTDPTGQPLLIKGGTEKYTVRVEADREEILDDFDPSDPDKRKQLYRVKLEERSRPVLHTLDKEGNLTFLNDPLSISELLRQHVTELARQLEKRNIPRYDKKPDSWEWRVMRPLSQGRHLPGRRETGLTNSQKHFAIALGRLLLADRSGFMNGEMGIGKTTVSLAVVEYLQAAFTRQGSSKSAYPQKNGGCYTALVVGPGIVTGDENWPKEIREVIPGATSRVIDATVRPIPKPVKISEWAKTIGLVFDDRDFEGYSTKQVLSEIIVCARSQGKNLDYRQITALRQTLKRAGRQPPRKRKGATAANLLDARIGGFLWLGVAEFPRDPNHARETARRYSLAQFIREYQAGQLPEKSFAILSYETAKLGAGRVPAMPCKRILRLNEKGDRDVVEVCTCPQCGVIVSTEYDDAGQPVIYKAITPGKKAVQFIGTRRRTCQAPVSIWAWNPETQKHEWQTVDADGRMLVCGTPLFQETKIRREAAARYVQRKAKNAFPVLLIDEIHEAKAKGTGNGWALSVLSGCSPYVLGLTGTLFSGYATSIFWLMHRLSSLVRSQFGFHEERRWARQFGLLRHTFYVSRPEDVFEDGSYTGPRYLNRVDEKPGILPAIIRYGLPKIVFASLQDVGLPLPPYQEEMVWLQMSPAMQAQYDEWADGSFFESPPAESLYAWAVEEMKAGTRSALSVWLNAALNRPNAMFRDETVCFNRRIEGKGKYAVRREEEIRHLPAVEMAAPKDLWLAERCLAERREGRKSLVFVRQTGKRDIQPHLVEVLKEYGLRVGVLSPSISPRRRVAWIQHHAPGIDVLLTNARLVKVGLNLRMFSTAIFYEFEWSLAILWQAMRRVYRPGAPLPVRILFPAYENTLEERALSLIGQKMKAASLFYGDEVASALTEEGESDFLNELVRSVLQKDAVMKASGIFGIENDLTAAPSGSPTAGSPIILPVMSLDQWISQRGLAQSKKRRPRKPMPNTQQLSLMSL